MFINFQDRFTRARCVLFLNLVVLKLTFLIILKLLHTTGRLHFGREYYRKIMSAAHVVGPVTNYLFIRVGVNRE